MIFWLIISCAAQLGVPELPLLPEPLPQPGAAQPPSSGTPPPPVDRNSARSVSSTRRRPLPPPKDNRRSRPSMLHVSASQPELIQHQRGIFRRRTGRRHQYPILSQLASLKHWFVESAKRAKSPHGKVAGGPPHRKSLADKLSPAKGQEPRKGSTPTPADDQSVVTPTQVKRASNASSFALSSASYSNRRNSYPHQPRSLNTKQVHRNSLSPSPMTPRGSYRRSSAGLRGRKSTSSSVSSIRSIHHTHSHSKTSSVSSNSVDTASTPTARASKSPHSSVKVLPTTPSASARFPSNLRLVRGASPRPPDTGDTNGGIRSAFNEGVPSPLVYSPSSSLVFARRKRSAFKGPMMHTANLMVSGGMASSEFPKSGAVDEEPTTAPAPRKSQIIEEEEDIEEDIEEVDTFGGPADAMNVLESQSSPVEIITPAADTAKTPDESLGQDKPGLAPPPDLDSSPTRPPRSSSLRASRSKTSESKNANKSNDPDNTSARSVAPAN